MGSPIAPIIADIWMQHFEENALRTSSIKPLMWKRYVDDTFCVLKKNQVESFLNHLNSIHEKVKFTMEKEHENSLAFLDVKVIRKQDGSIGHTVFRKSTHTDRYLHATSHHHPSNLQSVISSLVNRAHKICDPDHLKEELKHVDSALEKNGYSLKQRTWQPKPKIQQNSIMEEKKSFFTIHKRHNRRHWANFKKIQYQNNF